jgi:A/G-specific adenine glycosylase
VDANVARVLARMHNLREPVDSTIGRSVLREASAALQDGNFSAREVNSAVMELGALVCKPRAPRCPECPIRGECRTPDPESLPVKRARQAVTAVIERRAYYREDDRIFLAQSTGRWRGMWILPLMEREGKPDHVEVYSITRYRVRMELFHAPPPANQAGVRAFPIDALAAVPIPSPHRRAIRALAASASKVQI